MPSAPVRYSRFDLVSRDMLFFYEVVAVDAGRS